MKISGCVICYNEEDKIENCLRSLDFCDEIVVVDSLSGDGTVAIVEALAADESFPVPIRLFHQEFLGHVGQKNFANQKTRHDWIFGLDADEEVSAELKQSILAIKNREQEPEVQVWRCNRLTWYVTGWVRHGGWYPDRKIRFFRKGSGEWAGKNPHDFFQPARNTRVGYLRGDILHYSYDSLSDHLRTIESFTTIGADSAYQAGRRSNWLVILSRSVAIFVKMYVLRGGFLDGTRGFILAGLSSFHVFTKYAKLWMRNREVANPVRERRTIFPGKKEKRG